MLNLELGHDRAMLRSAAAEQSDVIDAIAAANWSAHSAVAHPAVQSRKRCSPLPNRKHHNPSATPPNEEFRQGKEYRSDTRN